MVSLTRNSRRESALISSLVDGVPAVGGLSELIPRRGTVARVWLNLVLGRNGSFSRMVLRIASMPSDINSFASNGVLPANNS
jgi:hypothetical protein